MVPCVQRETVLRLARAVYSAHVHPAGPPPTMTTSHSTSSGGSIALMRTARELVCRLKPGWRWMAAAAPRPATTPVNAAVVEEAAVVVVAEAAVVVVVVEAAVVGAVAVAVAVAAAAAVAVAVAACLLSALRRVV